MTRRSRDWNESLARDLRQPGFAREFMLGLLDEGFTLQAALAKTIRAYGVNEFAGKAKMASPNVLRSIGGRHNPTQMTLEQLLKPFGLKLTVAPVVRRRHKAA